jgi:hypothetical protein
MALESIYEFEIKIFISTRFGNSEATMQQIKKKDRRSSTSSRGVEENNLAAGAAAGAAAAAAAAEWNAELERVADKFDKNDVDQVATVATVIQPLGEAFAALVPQLTRASEMVREELQVIRAKEDGDLLRERFGRQIDDYKQVSFICAVTLHAALCFLQYH